MFKRKVVAIFYKWVDGWNSVIHQEIESRVHAEYRRNFPGVTDDTAAMIPQMREFYYVRTANTASLLVAIASVFVSFVALIVAIIALKC